MSVADRYLRAEGNALPQQRVAGLVVCCSSAEVAAYAESYLWTSYQEKHGMNLTAISVEFVTLTSAEEAVASESESRELEEDLLSRRWVERVTAAVVRSINSSGAQGRKVESTGNSAEGPPHCSFFGEPYFHELRHEWALEHFLLFSQLSQAVAESLSLPSTSHSRLGGPSVTPNVVHIWMGLCQCEALWRSRCGEVSDVLGLDLRALNGLLEPTGDSVTSAVLSQWGGTVVSSTLVGLYDGTLIAKDTWTRTVSFSTERDCVVHGVAMWCEFGGTEDPHMSCGKDGAGKCFGMKYFDRAYVLGAATCSVHEIEITVTISNGEITLSFPKEF